MMEKRNAYQVWWKSSKEVEALEDLGVEGDITFKWIIKKGVGRSSTGFIWRRMGMSGGRLTRR
jgi:hypothetical protein